MLVANVDWRHGVERFGQLNLNLVKIPHGGRFFLGLRARQARVLPECQNARMMSPMKNHCDYCRDSGRVSQADSHGAFKLVACPECKGLGADGKLKTPAAVLPSAPAVAAVTTAPGETKAPKFLGSAEKFLESLSEEQLTLLLSTDVSELLKIQGAASHGDDVGVAVGETGDLVQEVAGDGTPGRKPWPGFPNAPEPAASGEQGAAAPVKLPIKSPEVPSPTGATGAAVAPPATPAKPGGEGAA